MAISAARTFSIELAPISLLVLGPSWHASIPVKVMGACFTPLIQAWYWPPRLFFAVTLRWLPTSGYVDLFEELVPGIRSLVLPAITLGTAMAAVVTRMVRSSLLEVLEQDYIRTARSKGLRERTVVVRHALKNALIPVVTIVGLQTGNLIGGAVITEYVFGIPGVGRLVVDSIFSKDYPMVQGVVLLTALAFVTVNLLVDVLYGYLDPRIRYS